MIGILLHQDATDRPRRYLRVEISENLFGEYSLHREWGAEGGKRHSSITWMSNLRDAVIAAEQERQAALACGFSQSGTMVDQPEGPARH